MSEGSRFLQGEGGVHETLKKITGRLSDLGVPYAVVGGLALFRHGFRRFTEDVDILVTRDGLKLIHDRLTGLGYVPPFEKSKNLRDAHTGVKIEFLIAGQFPGDGKPKAIAFPDPAAVGVEFDGIRYLDLRTLIELKLASGLSSPDRLKDLVDVQELIKIHSLPADLADHLHPDVQAKYTELWTAVRSVRKRYVLIWRNKWLTADTGSIADMATALESAAAELRAMLADGVQLDPSGGTTDDYAHLVTTDPAVAQKYHMEDESEFWDDDEESDRVGTAEPDR